ncbi:MAG TPA: dihydrolipoamide acetyltransferase family protein, partial [Chloroflexota bacterium]
MPTTIVMPQLGESVAEGVIGKWLKQEGDRIEKDEPIVEVITDKVNAEIPSPVAGTLQKITQPEGATVAVGQEIAIIADGSTQARQPEVANVAGGNGQQISGGSFAPAPAQTGPVQQIQARSTSAVPPDGRGERVRSSPLVRRLAEQNGINLAEVPGTGLGGRVSKQDILSFVQQRQSASVGAVATEERPHLQPSPEFEREQPATSAAVPSMPAPTKTTSGYPQSGMQPEPGSRRQLGPNEELVPVSPLRKMIANRMVQSVFTIPHATTMAEVDMRNVTRFREAKKDEFRAQEGVPLSYVAFVIKATVEALKEFPLVNAEWTDDGIILKRDININVAVDAPEGLITPVIPHADEKSVSGLSKAIYDLAMRGRTKKLRIEDMQGGTFTVNNTGALGSVSGVSIINYPQAGILAAGTIVKRPVVIEQDGQDLIA